MLLSRWIRDIVKAVNEHGDKTKEAAQILADALDRHNQTIVNIANHRRF